MLSKKEIITGRAVAATGQQYLFADPRWEERFDILIRLTQRTKLIQALTGTDASAERIKAAIDKRMAEMGFGNVLRPRGVGQLHTSKQFLGKMIDKYDASYLLNLHFGANGPGSSSIVETNLGAALDKRMETYLRYRSDLYENPEDARLNFETYVVLIAGVKSHDVPVHTCKECKSRYVWPTGGYAHQSCPICAIHAQDAVAAKNEIRALIEKRDQAKSGVARYRHG